MEKMFITLQEVVENEIEELKITVNRHSEMLEKIVAVS